MNYDATAQTIKFASVAVLGVAVLALAAGAFIPFNVQQPATVQAFAGNVEIVRPDSSPTPLQTDTTLTLEIGHSVRTQPDSEAYIIFELTQGRARLNGSTLLTLVDSHRRATGLGHALDRGDQAHTLTLKQTQGRVTYIFAHTTPHFSDMQLVIQLPDGNYVPDGPCWTITIDAGGQSTVESLTCPTFPA